MQIMSQDPPAPTDSPRSAEAAPNRGGRDADSAGAASLLDAVLERPPVVEDADGADGRYERFAAAAQAGHIDDALCLWFDVGPETLLAMLRSGDLSRRIDVEIASLDRLLNEQVNAILHHPRLQQLEASWRGLQYVVEQAEAHESVKVRMLNTRWKELADDAEHALDFDQSQLFRKVYEEEYGMPGGEPYGVLFGDYQIRPGPSREHPIDDIATLTSIAGVAASSFTPFIAAAHPSLLGVQKVRDLERPMLLSQSFEQAEFLAWNRFRDSEDARFVGLTLPRIAMRPPLTDDGVRRDGFRFREESSHPDGSGYLWANAIYAYAGVLIRAFGETGWLADIRGVRTDESGGGLVDSLPMVDGIAHESAGQPRSNDWSTPQADAFAPGLAAQRPSVEVVIPDILEKELGDLGFLPISRCKDVPCCAFYGSQSAHRSKKYNDDAATVNARMSSMLHYSFCASRFAHYLKVLARDKIGSMESIDNLQQYLSDWLAQYIRDDDEAATSIKARYPLREARVTVRDMPNRPGAYYCEIHLRPHYQLDALAASVKLTTELAQSKNG